MPTGEIPVPPFVALRGAASFEPSAALAVLDGMARPESEAGLAWDAAWIACLTGSRRWAETARRAFARVGGHDTGERA